MKTDENVERSEEIIMKRCPYCGGATGLEEVEILEFGDIDDEFINFVKNELWDYDQLKDRDIFEVNAVK